VAIRVNIFEHFFGKKRRKHHTRAQERERERRKKRTQRRHVAADDSIVVALSSTFGFNRRRGPFGNVVGGEIRASGKNDDAKKSDEE
jgi:hypothetical protein